MTKSDGLTLLLMRCGATEWEEAGRVAGAVDLPLTPAGRAAVEQESQGLRGRSLSAVLTGPDEASLETARIYAKAVGVKPTTVAGLHEIRLGLWEGLRAAQLEEKYPKAYRQWLEDPAAVLLPGGEAVQEAMERLVSELARAVERLKDTSEGVGVVLRPLALAIVRCWLEQRPTAGLWVASGRPNLEWHVVSRERLRQAREASRVEAS